MDKLLYTPKEAAEALGISTSSFYRLVRYRIPSVQVGESKMPRFRRADLEAFVEGETDDAGK